MSRIVRELAPARAKVPAEQELEEKAAPAVDQQRQQDTADCLGVARCPWCRGPLVARMGCAGPYWQCLCANSAFGPPPGE